MSSPRRAAPPPSPVYAIADAGVLGAEEVPDAVAAMARGGAQWIQLRAKDLPDARLLELALACRRALRRPPGEAPRGVRLWIDDRPDVAALVAAEGDGADIPLGVHLGQEDLPPGAVRGLLPGEIWIGRSTHGREQVLAAHRDPAVDVVALGPVYETSGKERPDPVVGLDAVRWARRATDKPLVAIGGIDAARIAAVLEAGADAAAMISAVGRGEVEETVRRLAVAAGTAARPAPAERGTA